MAKIQIISNYNFVFKFIVNLKKSIVHELKKSNIITKYDELFIPNDFFSPLKAVPDVWRYEVIVKRVHSKIKFDITPPILSNTAYTSSAEYPHDTNPLNNNYLKSIIIVLESPHKDEYDCKFNRIGPAQGRTGHAIDKNLNRLLIKLSEICYFSFFNGPDKYKIIICEPIPFQCSLHNVYKNTCSGISDTIRNNVWRNIWKNHNTQDYFIQRIKDYNPYIVINACTQKLNEKVRKVLYEYSVDLNNPLMLNMEHPAINWNKQHDFKIWTGQWL